VLNFEFFLPTKIIFGKGSEERTAELINMHGRRKVLFLYGGNSTKRTGLYDRIKDNLNAGGIEYIEKGGVKPNPSLSFLQETIKLCRDENIDFLLAVGGGSVIDTAKAAAIGVYVGESNVWDFFIKKQTPQKALPVGVVLTIAAAGSETSNSCIITNEEDNDKRGIRSELVRPAFAIMNPELTYTVSPHHTAAGIADIMAHVMERYFTETQNVDLTDRLCEGVLKCVIENGKKVMENPSDYNSRAEIMWAGSIAHNELLNTGRTGDWGSHHMGYYLSTYYGIAHGATLSIIFPAWMKYVYKKDVSLFAKFFNRVFDVPNNSNDCEAVAKEGIAKLESYWRELGMPVRMSEAGISDINEEKLSDMADKTLGGNETDGNFYKMRYQDIINIYKMAM
jgi:alcohol dehydrogenase